MEILIFKEIPRKALLLRKKYKKISDALTKQNVKFRRELPKGITFQYTGSRHTIKNEGQLETFLRTHKFDTSQTNSKNCLLECKWP